MRLPRPRIAHRRHRLLSVPVAGGAVGAGGLAVLAYFLATGAGTGHAGVGTLSSPASIAAAAAAPKVTVSWNASLLTGGSTVAQSYRVERFTASGTDVGGACGGSSIPASSGSGNYFQCTDAPGSAGSFKYVITAAYQSWSTASGFTNAVTLTFGPATQLVLSGSNASLASGTTRAFTATIEDAAGNTVTSGADSTDSITFSQTTGTGSVSGLTTVAASGGVAIDTVTGNLAGSVTLHASGTVNGNATTSNTINFAVTVGTATQIVLSGSNANLASGTTRVFTATVEDAAGNTVTSGADSTDSITFSKTAGTGSVSGLTTVAASGGVATDTVTGNIAGPVSIQASGTLNSVAKTSNTISFTVTFGTATQVVLSGSTANLASGTTRAFTATIEDAAGNTVTSGADSTDSTTFNQTTGTGSVSGLATSNAVAGVATDTVTGNIAGPVTLQASGTLNSVAKTSNTISFTVTFGTASKLVLAGAATPLNSGTTRVFTAAIEDAAGNTVTSGADSTDSITFSQTTGTGSVSGLTTVAASGGVATDTVTGNVAGSVTLQATGTLNGSATASNTINVTVTFGTATQLVFSGSTASLASGTARAYAATIEDAAGNTVTSGADSTASITFNQTTGTGSVSGLTTVAASGGVATDTITGSLAGTVALQASGTLNSVAKTSNTISFTVTFGTASKLVLAGAVTPLNSGSTRVFTATIEDAAGNTVTSGADSTDSITFSQTTGAGSVSGLATSNAIAGVATDTVTGNLTGSVTLQASGTLNSVATTSNTINFTVTFGTATQIVLSGSNANLASGATRVFTATIEDAAGNTVTSGADSTASITFAKTTGAGSVSGLTTVAASGGVATDTVTGNVAGSVTLQASGTLNSVAKTSNTISFTVTFGTATQLVLSGSNASLASGATRVFTATIEDAAGNTVTSGADSTDSITFSQTTGTGSVTGLTTVAAVAGVATDTVTGNIAGPVSIQASGTLNSVAKTSNTISFTVTFGTANKLVLAGAATPLASGTTRVFTATIEDAAGNTVTSGADSTDSITFSQTAGAGSVTGLTTVAASAGVATDTVTGNLAGSVTLQASGTLNSVATNSNTINFTVTVGTATQIVLSGSNASLASGATRVFTATIEDAAGNTVISGADSTDSITFSKTAGTGSVSGLTSPNAVAGVASDTVTGNLAGSVTLQASGTLNSVAKTSNTISFTVTFGPATQIVLSGSATNLASGTTRVFTATIEDAAGNTVTSGADSTDSITFSKTTGAGSVTGLTTGAASAGVATDTVTGNLAGSVTLQASGTLNSVATNSNTINFTVTFGTATQLVLSGSNANLASGATRVFTATVDDAAGNTVTSGADSSRSITFSKTAGTGSVTGLTTVAAVAGVATDTVTGNIAGPVSIQASGTLNSVATNSNTVSFTVTFGTATQLVFSTTPVGNVAEGTTFTTSPAVSVEDASSNVVTSDTGGVTLAINSGPAAGSLSCSNSGFPTINAVAGVATFTNCQITGTAAAGTYTLAGSRSGLTSTPASSNVVINVGAATKLAFTAQPTSNLNIQATGTSSFAVSVAVQDANGNTETSDNATTVTLAINNNPSSGVLTCTNTNGLGPVIVVSGVANFTGCAITKVGTGYTLTATSSPSRTAPANANAFNITAGNASQFVVSAPASGTAGTAITGITLTAKDANGNVVTGYASPQTIAWSGAATSPAGNAPTYPATTVSFTNGVSTTALSATLFTAGPNTLTAAATSPTVTGTSSTIAISALAASHLAWTSTSVTPGTPSGTCYFTCTYTAVGNFGVFKSKISLTDTYGNLVNASSNFNITVTTAPGGTFTGSATVTINSGTSTSSVGGDGTTAGELKFTTQNGSWTTDTLSMTNTGSIANNASASLSKN